MTTVTLAFFLSLVVALLMTPLVRRLAIGVGALDRVGATSRKVHVKETPRLGGLAIVLAFYGPMLGLLFVDSEVGQYFTRDSAKVLGLLGGGVVLVLLGIYDDIKGANATKKFAVQIFVAIVLYALGFRVVTISVPMGGILDLGVLSLPITVLWVVGATNAMNLIDGLDGLAAGIGFFAASSTLVVALFNDNVLMVLFMASLAGATLGFLVYNFNPASIFMGDTGSMFLGFVIAVTAIQTHTKSHATVGMLAPILALGVPIMDTLLAMVRRFVVGRPMFQADREHIHHRLIARGCSHRVAVLMLYGISLLLAAAAITISLSTGWEVGLVLMVSAGSAIVFMRWLGYAHFRSGAAERLVQRRKRNLCIRRAVRGAERQLRAAVSLEEVWACLCTLSTPLQLVRLALRVRTVDGMLSRRREFLWQAPEIDVVRASTLTDALGGTHLACWNFEVSGPGVVAILEVNWSDSCGDIGIDEENAVVQVLGALKDVFARLQNAAGFDVRERESPTPASPEHVNYPWVMDI